ncbi:ester cyclase [Parasedimentitalea psychrophila]|uniref:Ester cyclase n=1 Tax=Parasedimentitalea psychrophila TaxID=2997337 RepID=A0A9Y2KZR8_9RHOB|nr:ester cyclase [Parasedimentitalea psychrophila]WIY24184.1 ester cyclase [Parasedimentitalea psychrophila]
MTMTKTEFLQYWFDEVWSNGNLSVVDQMYGAESSSTGAILIAPFRREDICELVTAIRELLSDIRVTFSHQMEQEDWLAVRAVIDAERADNGAKIQMTGQMFIRFEGQIIAESHSHFNYISLFEQLGQIPPDAIPILLTGQAMKWK